MRRILIFGLAAAFGLGAGCDKGLKEGLPDHPVIPPKGWKPGGVHPPGTAPAQEPKHHILPE